MMVLRTTNTQNEKRFAQSKFEQIAIEMMFSKPILDKLRANPEKSPMFFGSNMLPRLYEYTHRDFGLGSYVLKSDFEGLDMTIGKAQLYDVFDIIESLIDFENFDGKPQSVSQQRRWKRVFYGARDNFINTLVMLPSGELIWLEGTVPSGSAFTILVDSLCTHIAGNYVARRTGHGIIDERELGDDLSLAVAGRPKLEIWEKIFRETFGLILSIKKTAIYGRKYGQRMFLGYDMRDHVLKRPTFEWFNMLLHPEKDCDSVEVSYSRFIAYMYLGGINDIKFCYFFEFYQSCYEIKDVVADVSKEMASKRDYGGALYQVKGLHAYTWKDFAYGLLKPQLLKVI